MADTQMVGVRTSVGGYYFDAVLKLDHNSKITMTGHPVEEGANITDHSFVEPKSLSIVIGMSDAATYLDSSFSGENRSVSAFEKLQELQEARQRLTIQTRLKTYKNMLIETMTVPDDFKTMFGLRVTIGLREIIVATTSTVIMPDRTSAAPQKTGQTNKGTIQPTTDNRSTLKKAADALRGGL